MSSHHPRTPLVIAAGLVLGVALTTPVLATADDATAGGWVDLSRLDSWRGPTTNWEVVGGTALDAKNDKKLTPEPGTGVVYNGPTGRAVNLVSNRSFGDVEVHVEFMVPKGSNSGVKLEEVYEIQIYDSHGVKTLTASHCGGVYPRAELLPKYHHIDKGYPPKANACKPPGEWQTLDIVFHAPKFDAAGKKTADARFVSVKLNGETVQDNLEVPCPTGNNWRNQEHPTGRVMLQGDHGAVAFRNVRARPLD